MTLFRFHGLRGATLLSADFEGRARDILAPFWPSSLQHNANNACAGWFRGPQVVEWPSGASRTRSHRPGMKHNAEAR